MEIRKKNDYYIEKPHIKKSEIHRGLPKIKSDVVSVSSTGGRAIKAEYALPQQYRYPIKNK